MTGSLDETCRARRRRIPGTSSCPTSCGATSRERFALRAPELTTEEFLLEAGRSADLTATHRELLSAFLATCDRVKFARYSPGEEESREALEVARRFLNETAASSEDPRTGKQPFDFG